MSVEREPVGNSSVTEEGKAGVRNSIAAGAKLDSPYLVMNALATVVAAYGLLENSAAVVIGAMIIAMLLGPIMGLALALVDGDGRLVKHALLAEFAGVLVVLCISILLGRIHLDLPLTQEILSRTKPNLLDLAIAAGGGAAGAYATVSPRLSVGLVGVAIATALVPPLAVCGICLSRGLFHLAEGAFILFLTNLVTIQCASSIVLFGFGFHKVTQAHNDKGAFIRRLAVDVLLFTGLAVFLTFQLASTVHQQQFEDRIKESLQKDLAKIHGAYLADLRFQVQEGQDLIVAVVRAPNSVTPAQTSVLQSHLPRRNERKTLLHVRSLLTKETTADGYVYEIQPVDANSATGNATLSQPDGGPEGHNNQSAN